METAGSFAGTSPAPGQVYDDNCDVVAAASVDGRTGEHRRSDASRALTAGPALARAPEAPLRKAAKER